MRGRRKMWGGAVALTLATAGLVAISTAPAHSAVGDSGSSSGVEIYASGGSASAALRGQIAWLSFGGHGDDIESGHQVTNWVQVSAVSRTEVTCTLTHVSGDGVEGYRPGSWNGDGFDNRYNIGGTNGNNQLVVGVINRTDKGQAVFDIDCTAALVTYDGSGWAEGNRVSSTPITLPGLVIADAESQNRATTGNQPNEYISARPFPHVPNSSAAWRIIDRNQGCSTGPNMVANKVANGTLTLRAVDGNGAECSTDPGTAMVVAHADGVTAMRVTLQGQGLQAAAFGYILNPDFGDAPQSFGVAGAVNLPWTNSTTLSNGTTTVAATSGSTSISGVLGLGTATAAASTIAAPRLGPSLTFERTPLYHSSAAGDSDNAFSAAPGTLGGTQAGLDFSLTTARCRGIGSMTAWLDWNRNGVFDAGERSNTVSCTSTGTNGTAVTLNWTVPVDAQGGATFLRIIVAATPSELAPTGIVSQGEVEDYQVTAMVRDLRVTKTANVTQMPAAGGVVSYSVTVTNIGNAAYTNGVPARLYDDVTNVVDDAVRGTVTRTPTSAPDPTTTSTRISWVGPLAAGASVSLNYTMTVRSDAQVGDRIMSNIARVSNTAIGTATALTCVADSADEIAGLCARVDLYRVGLDVTKQAYLATDTSFSSPIANASVLAPGTAVVWRYTVRNTGSIALTDIQLTDVATDTKTDASGSVTATTSPVITCGGLTPGTTVTISTLAGGAQRVCQASG